ncbi:MAG: hypothetical protein HW381_1824 [Candidatus Rokubacteria bacterium]|nr:hypothetical protein [Candidatus Rokubacteria bacterium]
MAALGCDARRFEPGGPRPDDHHALRPRGGPDRVLALAGRAGVRHAEDRQVLPEEVAAREASHAGADLIQPPLEALARHVGVGVERAAERDEIGIARLEHGLGHARVGDPPRDADGHRRARADAAAERGQARGPHLHRLDDPDRGLVDAGGDVEEVDTGPLEARHDLAHVVDREAARHVLVRAEAIEHRHLRADGLPDGGDDLEGEAQAPLEVAAVLVGAAVRVGGEELADQVAVGAVHLHHVEARGRRAARRFREPSDDRLDLLHGKLPGGVPGGEHGARDRRRRDGLPPRDRRRGLAPAEVQLRTHERPVAVAGLDEAPVAGDQPVVMDPSARRHGSRAGGDGSSRRGRRTWTRAG